MGNRARLSGIALSHQWTQLQLQKKEPHLLLTARLVKVNNNVRICRLHVARRVVEREVAVLTHPDKRHVNRHASQKLAQPSALLLRNNPRA